MLGGPRLELTWETWLAVMVLVMLANGRTCEKAERKAEEKP